MKDKLLLFDIGGSSIKCGIWEKEELVHLDKVPTPKTWEEMKKVLKGIFDQYSDSPYTGVAISCPGAVDTEKGMINGVSALPYIHGFPIKKAFSSLFGVPVSMQNDANCAGLAELWKGNAQGASSVCCMIIGTGIGGALIIDGKLQSGHTLFGGEFGYQIIDRNSLVTLSEAGSPVKMGKNYTKEKADKKVYEGQEVFELADNGDKLAKEMVNHLYDTLSLAIYNLLVSINPQKVLIGGGISKRNDLIYELNLRTEKLLKDNGAVELEFELQTCKFFNDSNLIGAAYQYVLENQ
ncbi:ROK family protein [Marinilactibacillus psychrotolerans]|uniref:Transcriptional regulator / sugar kinase NagC n=1 Tax=Marinilactibacillus psychrotolerans TaxID=191770 RepID=A0AAV3WXA3_9LACT|nr:ROK family protein [Marinilactibacillus psychrotolerans]GEL67394.1 N-acetylmannosamine kinase [Marinilactibacillus psychrotolerans]GEQ36369.1 transcriptional regulator / sugar kinase NagC [Marinilactibacillus psychrotolerans]SDD00618.1 Sugar kinase of the NBD/HSP70 family, may contain an N-terminal HTH domain [Marinilactibacillus psychrotolerans]